MNIQTIKALPLNTKLLLGIAALGVVALLYGILRTTYFSDDAMDLRKGEADSERYMRVMRCEQQVEQNFYGRLNTPEYRQALQECRKR